MQPLAKPDDLPTALRSGASPAGAPEHGASNVRVQLYTWHGVHIFDTTLDEHDWLIEPPPLLKWGNRFFIWHPHFSQYREVECTNIVAKPAAEPAPATPPQVAVPPVNAQTAHA